MSISFEWDKEQLAFKETVIAFAQQELNGNLREQDKTSHFDRAVWHLCADFGILGWLLLGSIPGVLIGGRLTLSIPDDTLRLVLAGVLGLAGLKLLDVPFAGTIIVVGLAAGLAGLLVYLGRHSWIRLQQRAAARPSPVE